MRRLLPLFALVSLLAGCDMLGIEGANVIAERRSAEGRAVGAACRHAGRAIEDCYALNKKAEKAAIYAGWREMDDYMRENKLEPVLPQVKAGESRPTAGEVDAKADVNERGANRAEAAGKTGNQKAVSH